MKKFFIQCVVNIAALFIVTHTVAGVSVANTQTTIIAAIVLGLLNTFLKPSIMLLTLPLNIFSLGILTFFINGFIFYLAARFVKGFAVADFWSAFWAAALFSAISFLLNMLLGPKVHFKVCRDKDVDADRPKYDNVMDVEGKADDY